MTIQKSMKEYMGNIKARINETPATFSNRLEDKLPICLWHATGECEKSGIRNHVKRENYDGILCKCFAYVKPIEKKEINY
jgi:hypothetical protein